MKRRPLIVVLLILAMTGAAVMVFGGEEKRRAEVVAADGQVPDGSLRMAVGRLQERLRDQPKDPQAWAGLGVAYIEQARQKADPSWYPKAADALERSLGVQPGNAEALAGQAALASARHDFGTALDLAERALTVNPYETRALASRVDALVELGRYDEAWTAVGEADARRPGIPIFTRYAYVLELRGDPGKAREVLDRALDSATDPTDIAFVRYQLGDLALNTGRARDALVHFQAALVADPLDLAALDGRARSREATGDKPGALTDREALVARAPLPAYAMALGELYDERGMPDKARSQYSIVTAWATLARANGVNPDLEVALFEADHGDPKAALTAARAEWTRRCGPLLSAGAPAARGPTGSSGACSVQVSDALAWAFHATGDDREALRYARNAARTGYQNVLFQSHLRTIEKSLGDRK